MYSRTKTVLTILITLLTTLKAYVVWHDCMRSDMASIKHRAFTIVINLSNMTDYILNK